MMQNDLIGLLKQNSKTEDDFELIYLIELNPGDPVHLKGDKKNFIKTLESNYSYSDNLKHISVDYHDLVIFVGTHTLHLLDD